MTDLLSGGRRRWRLGPILLAFVVLVLPIAIAAGGYAYVVRSDHGPGATPEVVDTPSFGESGGSLEPRSPAPVRLT
ncbi:MAG: hypothetical protein ACR2J6_06790, partial [Thermoleophilaceae bacterium]